MNTNDIETQRTIYLRNLEDLQERIIALSKTIKYLLLLQMIQ